MTDSAIRAVTVYCSSSRQIPSVYHEAGAELGRAVARAGWQLVYGGNRIGLMGVVADAAREAGGKVVGITPKLLVDKGMGDDFCTELIVTQGMRERKALLEQRGDAFIALPGGLGTFEEFFEILVGRWLGYHEKPIVLLNVAGYYNPLLAMIDHGIEHRFIRAHTRDLFFVADTVTAAINYLRRRPDTGPPQIGEPDVGTSAIE
jgi:uncharacterized protein (TIGR00730 family)